MSEKDENLHFLDYWRVISSRKEIIIAVFLVVVVTGALVTYSMPKKYRASVKILVEQDIPDLEVFGSERLRFDPLFLRTQFEIIQSRPVMEEVIRRTDLNEKLSKAYGYDVLGPDESFERTRKLLSRSMMVRQYRDTNLIEIEIVMAEPQETVRVEVAKVAQAVAEVYRDIREEKNRAQKEVALRALDRALKEQQGSVMKMEELVDNIVESNKLDLIETYNEEVRSLNNESMRQLESLRINSRMDLATKEAKYEIVKALNNKELEESGMHIVNDMALAELVANKRGSEVRLKEVLQKYGPKHPDVLTVQAVIKEIDVKIGDALEGLKLGVRSGFEEAKAKVGIIEKELEELRSAVRRSKSQEYQEYERAKRDLERARRIRDALDVRHIQEKIVLGMPKTTVEVVEPARIPKKDEIVSPKVLLNIILSIFAGLASGIGLAYFIEYLDTSVKTIEEIEQNLGISVLGVIPQKVKSFADTKPDPGHAEAYRVLRTNIIFSNSLKAIKGGKAICVTSGSMGEGKSLTVFNLAYICAQLGDRVLIVDADLHRPRQHKIMGVSNSIGLANVLVGEIQMEDAVLATSVSNLDFLPSGRIAAGVHGLMDSRRTKEIVEELKGSYDIVFFDSPPIIGVSDTSMLVREVDAVMQVIQHRKYPLSVSQRARNVIENVGGGNHIGIIMNRINATRDYSYYYYHHHYYSYPQKQGQKD